jgi:hypothetical protein
VRKAIGPLEALPERVANDLAAVVPPADADPFRFFDDQDAQERQPVQRTLSTALRAAALSKFPPDEGSRDVPLSHSTSSSCSAYFLSQFASEAKYRLDEHVLRLSLRQRLGMVLATNLPTICAACPDNVAMDPHGDHMLSCKHTANRTATHHAQRDRIGTFLNKLDVAFAQEPVVGEMMVRGELQEVSPDHALRIGNRLLWLDNTSCCPTSKSQMRRSAANQDEQLARRDKKKIKWYRPLADAQSATVIPLASDTAGRIGRGFMTLYKELEKSDSISKAELAIQFRKLLIDISHIIQWGNARYIRRALERHHQF